MVICGVLLDIAAIILWLKGSTEGYRDSSKRSNLYVWINCSISFMPSQNTVC